MKHSEFIPDCCGAELFSIIGSKDLTGGSVSLCAAQLYGDRCIDALHHDPLECSVSPGAVMLFFSVSQCITSSLFWVSVMHLLLSPDFPVPSRLFLESN